MDAQQERHKEWRSVVQESDVERYHDCPLEGPATVLHLLKHMLRFGGSLETLTEVVILGGTYEQLNMPSLMSFEKASQRLQLIVEAHAEVGQAPSWKMAGYYNGVSTLTDVVSPALRQYGTRRAKEEAEVGLTRVRQLHGVV